MITLRKIQQRINDVVTAMDERAKGDSDADLPLLLTMRRHGRTGKPIKEKRFIPSYLSGSRIDILTTGHQIANRFGFTEIVFEETDELV